MPSVFNVAHTRAKKRYRCCECFGFIEVGQRYEYAWGIWAGDAGSYKTCWECARLRKEVAKASECCVPFRGLLEEICNLDDNDSLKQRFFDIRIMRGADICPDYHREENEI